MLAVALDVQVADLESPQIAGRVLHEIGKAVPARRRNRRATVVQPENLAVVALSSPTLDATRRKEGAVEFATLGSGNHFIELQADEDGRLWLMVHSGSRALGQAIREFHLARARPVSHRLRALDANSPSGVDYLKDVEWARRFARESR